MVARTRRIFARVRGWAKLRPPQPKMPPLPPPPKKIIPPPPPRTLGLVEFGNIVFPMVVLVGGDGETRYTWPKGIECIWSTKTLVLPKDVQRAYPALLEKRRELAKARGAVFEQREHIRLDDYEISLQYPTDKPWPLRLIVSKTDYYTIQATNYSLDELLPGGSTIREKYAYDPRDFRNSILANPLAVNLAVVTADRQICLAVRGRKTAVTPGGYAPAISGTGSPQHDLDEHGNYSPFLTAMREGSEEIIGFKPSLEDVVFFGLARTWKYQLPFLFGEIRLKNVTAEELKAMFPRDHWETEGVVCLPLDPEAIVFFIREIYQDMEESQITGSATYAALFSILMSLRYEYPADWKIIIKELSKIQPR